MTVATFGDLVEANLARNRLETGGVQAVLADVETVAMIWSLDNAVGGIKLQVRAADAEQARAILAEPPGQQAEAPEGVGAGTERDEACESDWPGGPAADAEPGPD